MLVFELLTFVSIYLHRCSTSRSVPDVDLVIPPAAAGEANCNEILKLAENPKYGKCWTKVLANLEKSCRSMREEQQQILALYFTNFHLLISCWYLLQVVSQNCKTRPITYLRCGLTFRGVVASVYFSS